MKRDPIALIEYEALILGRHLAGLPGRSRRRGSELDQSAYTILSLLEAGGPASLGELSASTGLERSTLTRQTGALLRNGYAERTPDPEGGMARKYRPTELGSALAAQERRANYESMERIMSAWTEEDRLAFAGLLARFNRGIEERTQRAWPRAEVIPADNPDAEPLTSSQRGRGTELGDSNEGRVEQSP